MENMEHIQTKLTNLQEALNAALKKLDEKEQELEDYKNKSKQEGLKRILSERVYDPEAALKLITEAHYDKSGAFDINLFIKQYPFFAKREAPQLEKTTSPNSGSSNRKISDVLREEYGI